MSASAMSSGRTRWAALLLGLFGLFGAHRFYLGRYQSGLVMCLTMLAGIFFPLWAGTGKMEAIPAFAMLGVILWWAVDVIRVMSGGLTDAEGMRLGWRAGPAPVPERSRQVATFLVLLGPLGAHRFYLGQIWYGLLMLFTFGGYGVLWLIDLWLVLSGRVRDKERRALRSGAPVPSPTPAKAPPLQPQRQLQHRCLRPRPAFRSPGPRGPRGLNRRGPLPSRPCPRPPLPLRLRPPGSRPRPPPRSFGSTRRSRHPLRRRQPR